MKKATLSSEKKINRHGFLCLITASIMMLTACGGKSYVSIQPYYPPIQQQAPSQAQSQANGATSANSNHGKYPPTLVDLSTITIHR